MKKEKLIKSGLDCRRLEMKMNLLNDKVDRLMEFFKVELVQPPDIIELEEEKKRKVRERQQAKILHKESIRVSVENIIQDRRLRRSSTALEIREKFNLRNLPAASRIKEYQRTSDPCAFDGLA